MPLIRKGANDPNAAISNLNVNIAIAGLQNASAQERWTAARALAAFPGTAALLGQTAGREKDERVREAIFTSLARINSAEGFEATLPHLRSDDANLRTGALDALRAMTNPVQARLADLLADADPDVRALACELARNIPAGDATRLLCQRLETDPDVNVCAAAIDVLAEIGSLDALASLARCTGRFPEHPFLCFAVKVASERIGLQPAKHND